MDSLTKRETAILRLVIKGLGNKEIANQLTISTNTVKTHLCNIYSRFEIPKSLNTRVYMAVWGVRNGYSN